MAAYRQRGQATTVYQIVTDRIVTLLEKGVAPWRKPWASSAADWPKNLVSRRDYRGVNVFLLSAMRYESPFWLTYKQAESLGGNVRKGEKATPVVFWKLWERDGRDAAGDDTGGTTERRGIPVLRYYSVFNVAQCDGIDAPALPMTDHPFLPIADCETIVANMPKRPDIRHGESRAYYSPACDYVNMPRRETFETPEAYYATLFHELTHSTGHESRLHRRGSEIPRRYGDPDYSREELVAEMGAAFLCGVSGITPGTIDNAASYLAGWIRALRGDPKLVVVAASQAQKAADFILDRSDNAAEVSEHVTESVGAA